MLISRTWHGSVPLEHGDAFAAYLEKTGVQESRSIPGSAAACIALNKMRTCISFSVLCGLPGKPSALLPVRRLRLR